MRICFLTHNLRKDNGGGVLSRQVIEGLKTALGAEVSVVTTLSSDFADEQTLFTPRWFFSPKKLLKIFKLVRGADAVHTFDAFPYGAVAAVLTIFSRIPVFITVVGTGSIRYLYLVSTSHLARFAMKRAKRVIAISDFTKREILKKVPSAKVAVIHPGIDIRSLKRDLPEESFKRPNEFHPYILSVGSLRFRKGYKYAIPAFKRVSEVFPDLQYVIVGKKYTDKEYNRLRGLVRDFNLEGKVHILHDVNSADEALAFYRKAKLFCLMSLNIGHDIEGFGIVFLEAAATGLPVVGSKGCGVEDATEGGRNGILVEERNANEFAKAVITILRDENLYRRFASESLKLAEDFDWNKAIDRYASLYRQTLK